MYDSTAIFLVSYIKSFLNIQVFDAHFTFVSLSDYASFYIINLAPVSPHPMVVDDTGFNAEVNTKIFTYKENSDIHIRVEFRGDASSSNMEMFKHSFLLEDNKTLLKDAGYGYFGMGAIEPIVNIRESKEKGGFFTTIKLKASSLVIDESQIIDTIEVSVSNKLEG